MKTRIFHVGLRISTWVAVLAGAGCREGMTDYQRGQVAGQAMLGVLAIYLVYRLIKRK